MSEGQKEISNILHDFEVDDIVEEIQNGILDYEQESLQGDADLIDIMELVKELARRAKKRESLIN